MTDLDQALRAMLHERASDITTVPADFSDLDSLEILNGGADSAAHHRARWWTFAAAAALVALVVGVTVAVRDRDTGRPQPVAPITSHPHPTPTPTAPRRPSGATLRWSFALAVPPGYQLMDRALTAGFQSVDLRKVDDPDAVGCCGSLPRTVFVTLYRAGAFHADGTRSGTPVDVNGQRGYYGIRPAGPWDGIVPVSHKSLPTVSWEYAPNSWAVVRATTPTTQAVKQLLLVARAVIPHRTSAIRLPLRFGYVPASLRTVQASYNLPENYGTTVAIADGALGEETTDSLNIQVWRDAGPHEGMAGAKPVTVGGRSGRQTPDGAVSVLVGRRDVVIGLDGPHRSAATFAKILASVHWATDPSDTSTWLDATTLVP